MLHSDQEDNNLIVMCIEQVVWFNPNIINLAQGTTMITLEISFSPKFKEAVASIWALLWWMTPMMITMMVTMIVVEVVAGDSGKERQWSVLITRLMTCNASFTIYTSQFYCIDINRESTLLHCIYIHPNSQRGTLAQPSLGNCLLHCAIVSLRNGSGPMIQFHTIYSFFYWTRKKEKDRKFKTKWDI